MKLKRILMLFAVLSVVCGGAVAGFTYWEQRQLALASERMQQQARVDQERHRAEEKLRIIDAMRLTQDYEVPEAAVDPHRVLLLKQIEQTKSQFIVFPPSAPMYRANLDLTARIAIARQLAQMIEAETGVPVPDPAVVFEAYGAPRRTNPLFLPGYLMHSNVQWFISGYASHDGHGKMSIKLTKIPFKAQRPPVLPEFERSEIAISDAQPPESAFEPMAAEALRALGFKGTDIARVKVDAPSQLPLPESPALEASSQSPIEGLWLQQLIGVLHHSLRSIDPRPRERVFERTLAGLHTLAPESGDYRMLMARSLTYVGRPLAAVEVLKTSAATPEEKALLAYINGDVPGMKAALSGIERQIPRMIAECELIILRASLSDLDEEQQANEARRLMNQVPKAWQPLFGLLVAHQGLWTLPAPAQLKPLLDRDFPVEGYRAEDVVQGKSALGGSPHDNKMMADLMVSPLIHVRRWQASNPQALCCEAGSNGWQRYQPTQYLELLGALAAGEIVGHLHFFIRAQGRPESALHEADLYDQAYFHGMNTQIIAARIEALEQFGRQDPEHARGVDTDRQAAELSQKVLSWDSAQSYATAEALVADARFNYRGYVPPRMQGKLLPGADASLFDFPRRPVWALHASHAPLDPNMELALKRSACLLTIGDILPCTRYVELTREQAGEEAYRKQVAALIESRFAGSGERAVLLSEIKIKDGDREGAEALLKQTIVSSPRQMSLYSALGQLQMSQGRYSDAAKTYMTYPGLKDRDANSVELSNYLYPAAMSLLERGAAPEARQLLSTVAQYRDGSYSNLGGVISLALMDGRYELAREVLQDQYGRYHSANSAGKLINLQFMMGNSQEAWSAIKQEARASRIWTSIVGLRMANADPARIAQWSAEDADMVNHYGEPARIMFNAMSVDRPADSIRKVYEIDVQARAATKNFKMKEPTLKEIKEGAKADGFLSYPAMIDGYAAFKERDYAQAVAALKSIYENSEAGSPPHRGGWHTSFLPHYAFAAAKAGKGDDASAIDQSLRARRTDAKGKSAAREELVPDFEHHLILAIAQAFNDKHAEAMSEVQLARASLGDTDLLYSGYVFVEILERLSEETRQPAYLASALEYARAHQRLEPWESWAYAFEARHAASGPARVRAAGIALKLDPQSLWLQEMDKQTLAQARQWASHNRWPGKDAPNAAAKWNRT